jgi:signal transduction histidine kinase
VTVRHRVLGALVAALAAAAAAVVILALGHRGDPDVSVGFIVLSTVAGLAFAAVGALLVAERPGNALGPILLTAGAALVVEFVLREFAVASDGTTLTSATLAARSAVWASLVIDPLFFPASIGLALLLFPDGRPASRRWRPVVALGVALTGVRILLLALAPGPLVVESYGLELPWDGVLPQGAHDAVSAIDGLLLVGSLLVMGAGAVSLALRFRRAAPDERQRLKPLAVVGVLAVLGLAMQGVPGLHAAGVVVLVAAVAILFPLALVVGALRYRVWDLDPLLVSALVYGGLALLVAAGYVAIVAAGAALGGAPVPDLGPALVATFAVALLLGPARRTVEHAARRLVYGRRATPYELLAALPHRLADAPATGDVLPQVAAALTTGLGVPAARVRALVDGSEPRVAWSPEDAAADESDEDALLVVPVRHLGDVVGDIAVRASGERLLGSTERHLLRDLAAQAGPALRAVALGAELERRLDQITQQSAALAASRERLAAAQVEERRRLERDIHDGAQQQLVGLAVRLQAAEEAVRAGDDGAATAALAAAHDDLDSCIDDLRELARGIYPPVLTASGLGPALRARARVGGNDVRVRVAPEVAAGRLPVAVETAVYFTCLEALQNAAKHAPEAEVDVELSLVDGELRFAVADDGPGFVTGDRAGHGSGLVGMADRLGAVGGTVTVTSAPGAGTTVAGRVPVPVG